MPTPVRVLDALAGGHRTAAVDVLFEYLAVSLPLIDLPVATSVAELPASLRAECEQPEHWYAEPGALLLAVRDADVVGCVGLRTMPQAGAVEVKRLYVRPAHRRTGVAHALMAAAHERARRSGFRQLMLDVFPTRTEVTAFYRRLGYTDAAPYRDYAFPMVFLQRPVDQPGPEQARG